MRSVRVPGPRRLEARRLNAVAKDLYNAQPPATVAMAIANPLSVPNSAGAANFGGAWVAGSTTSQAAALFLKLWCYTMRRNGNITPVRMEHAAPAPCPPFHGLVDPTTPALPYTLIIEDMVCATIASLAPEILFGIVDHITPGTNNTLVGIGFRAAAADGIWHAFVNDCPTGIAPVTVRRDTALVATIAAWHRLTIMLDGTTKTITWLVDRVVVDTWTPGAALDQMGANVGGPKVMVAASCPASVDVTVRAHPGSGAAIRYLVRNRS